MANPLPGGDGDINVYCNREAQQTRHWQSQRSVVFINGMANSAKDHKESAVALSKLQMCPVVGVYNQSGGTVTDLLQCLGDKWQWNSHGLDRKISTYRTLFHKAVGSRANAELVIANALSRNKCALNLLKKLLSISGDIEIFAHSQGNLILANVLTGIEILDGQSGLARFTVNSYGSPTVNWPSGFKHHDHGFTFDPVNWLSGFDSSFSISKVGVPTISEAIGVVSHGFKCYMADDATFVVNRFRWGSFGITANMDEEGLAKTLAQMGTNVPRVRAIFERLYSAHWSDVDDVAVLYVHKIKASSNVLNLVKADQQLKDLLIKSLEEGYTSGREQAAIDLLK